MQTPNFWYPQSPLKKSIWSYLLQPIAWLIYGISKLRFINKTGYFGKIPIICIGNATAGGTGKTPTAIMIAQQAIAMGKSPAFLTKGYGGTISGPYQVQQNDKAHNTGDEALILASHAPCFISKDRVHGAKYIDSLNKFDLIITDDGLQNHPSLYQNNAILTIDAKRLFGNRCLIPAGPLREPIKNAINKAKIILIIGNETLHKLPKELEGTDKPIIYARKQPLIHGADLTGENVILFSGLGNNQQFQDIVQKSGANILKSEKFPDHFTYNDRIIERLISQAQQSAALLVTTEKDMVKISAKYYPYIIPFLITLDIHQDDYPIINNMLEKI